MVAKRSFLFKGIFSSAAAFALVTFLNECLAWAHGDEVHAGAPKSKVVVPLHFQTVVVDGKGGVTLDGP